MRNYTIKQQTMVDISSQGEGEVNVPAQPEHNRNATNDYVDPIVLYDLIEKGCDRNLALNPKNESFDQRTASSILLNNIESFDHRKASSKPLNNIL